MADARTVLASRDHGSRRYETAQGTAQTFVEVQVQPPHLIIVGAGHIAVPLAEIALFVELGGRIGLWSTLALIDDGATHVGVASDHVIESFRNDLYAGYKTSAGMEPAILEQIPVMERALEAAGFTRVERTVFTGAHLITATRRGTPR